MWEELKEKVIRRKMICMPLKVEWHSDGESGKGELIDIGISDDFLSFHIRDEKLGVGRGGFFELGSTRSVVGVNSDVNGLRISAPHMGEIVILPDKKGEDGR